MKFEDFNPPGSIAVTTRESDPSGCIPEIVRRDYKSHGRVEREGSGNQIGMEGGTRTGRREDLVDVARRVVGLAVPSSAHALHQRHD